MILRTDTIKTLMDNLEKEVYSKASRIVRDAVEHTFEYIMDESPVYTGAYRSNNQVSISGSAARPENVATAAEKKEGKPNQNVGPSGTPVGRFISLIGEAHEDVIAKLYRFDLRNNRKIRLFNNSGHAALVEEVGGAGLNYAVYTKAEQKLYAELDKAKGVM